MKSVGCEKGKFSMEFNGYSGDYKAYCMYLQESAEEKYRIFLIGITPNADSILGVRMPLLRRIARKIIKTDWRQFLNDAQDTTHEELLMQALVIGGAKMELQERLEFVSAFVPKIQSWAVCDTFCSCLKFAKNHLQETWNFLQPYLYSDKEFELRFGIVTLMDYYICEDWIDRILPVFDAVRHEGYYTKMAQAWAISICYTHYPAKTMNLLNNSQLDDWTYNKTLQKITESLRVNTQEKQRIRAMKR